MDRTGFNFYTDYWCDLYKAKTPTGKTNPATLYAKLATIIGALSLIFFWLAIPGYFMKSLMKKTIAQTCGIAALVAASLLFTSFHDLVIPLGSGLGVVAIFLLMSSLRKWKTLYRLGFSVIVLAFVCNSIMYTRIADLYLPVLQKIAFIVTVIWAILVARIVLKGKSLNVAIKN